MARKHYDEEFRRNAVDLYETTPGATVRSIAADLGIERGTLRGWLDRYGTGRKAGADGAPTASPLHRRTTDGVLEGETPEEELLRLRARVRALEVETTKLTTVND